MASVRSRWCQTNPINSLALPSPTTIPLHPTPYTPRHPIGPHPATVNSWRSISQPLTFFLIYYHFSNAAVFHYIDLNFIFYIFYIYIYFFWPRKCYCLDCPAVMRHWTPSTGSFAQSPAEGRGRPNYPATDSWKLDLCFAFSPVGRGRCFCRRAAPPCCSDAATRRNLWPWKWNFSTNPRCSRRRAPASGTAVIASIC